MKLSELRKLIEGDAGNISIAKTANTKALSAIPKPTEKKDTKPITPSTTQRKTPEQDVPSSMGKDVSQPTLKI
jgi:hypothetical protein